MRATLEDSFKFLAFIMQFGHSRLLSESVYWFDEDGEDVDYMKLVHKADVADVRYRSSVGGVPPRGKTHLFWNETLHREWRVSRLFRERNSGRCLNGAVDTVRHLSTCGGECQGECGQPAERIMAWIQVDPPLGCGRCRASFAKADIPLGISEMDEGDYMRSILQTEDYEVLR